MPKVTKFKTKNMLSAPAGLSADAADYYVQLRELAAELYPVLPIDGALIEVAARNFDMARAASETANEDLRREDVRAWIASQKLALSAGAGLRSALTALKLSPEERSGKATAQVQAVKVLEGDADWGHLLD
jgi:hypothetical protein